MDTKSKNGSVKSINNQNSTPEPDTQDHKKTMDYFRDEALDSKNEDKFQHLHYVDVLKDVLLKSETPINVGLYGKWGVGKSSILHMLKEEISNDEKLKKFKYVEIDAWGLSHASLQQEILEVVNSQLGEDEKAYKQNAIEDELYNVRQIDSYDFSTLKKFRWILVPISLLVSAVVIFGDFIDDVTKVLVIGASSILALLLHITRLFVRTTKRIIPKTTSSLKFREIYEKIITIQKKKVVVVIDNLDRCDDETAVKLLGLIQTFMVQKNCINILACDDEAIITHLRNVKGKQYTDRDGNEFLSKFFQVTLRIPPFIGENLGKYTEDLMNRRNIPFGNFVRQVLISGAVENPRKINQFLNNVVALYRLAEFKERDQKIPQGAITKHTDFLTKIIIIRHEWPEFFKEIEAQPNILNDDESRTMWIINEKKKNTSQNNEKENHSIRALEKFLNRTRVSYVEDVTPFLRLNRESYAAESGMDEFGIAITTLDPITEKIFKKLEKQTQHLKKIEDLMDEHEEKNDPLTLATCALSLINILKYIKNPKEYDFALAVLGRHLSKTLLDAWDKFDLDKYNMFELLEKIPYHLSSKFYKRLVYEIFSGDKINEKLLSQFMNNDGIISVNTMNMVDDAFSKFITKHPDHLDVLVKCCNEYGWSENNISKPSKTISFIIDQITFGPLDDYSYMNTYKKIKKNIDISERKKFLIQIKSALQRSVDGGKVFSDPLMDAIKEINENTDENMGENISQKQEIFKLLTRLMRNIPEQEQSETLLNVMIDLAKRLESVDVTFDVNILLEDAIVSYFKGAEYEEMLSFLKKDNYKKHELLKSKVISSALAERFIVLDPNNRWILRHLLKDIPHESQEIIARKLNKLIRSEDPSQYLTLLKVAQELDEEFNFYIIDSIRETCREVAFKKDSGRHTFYQHVLKLKPSRNDIQEIVDYSNRLITDYDTAKQDEGLELLRLVNSNTDLPDIRGFEKAIEQSIILLQQDSERVNEYMSFIFTYRDRWSQIQQIKLQELFRKGLEPVRTKQILSIVLSYVDMTQLALIKDILDELIVCAQQTPHNSIKEQIKKIFFKNKENLNQTQLNKIWEIYGYAVDWTGTIREIDDLITELIHARSYVKANEIASKLSKHSDFTDRQLSNIAKAYNQNFEVKNSWTAGPFVLDLLKQTGKTELLNDE